MVLKHKVPSRLAIFEVAIWRVPVTRSYPEGIKYRAWCSEKGRTIFGFDNLKDTGAFDLTQKATCIAGENFFG